MLMARAIFASGLARRIALAADLEEIDTLRDEIEDRFGNSQRIGRIGVSRDVDETDVTLYRPGPVEAIGMTVEEIRFIMDRTVAFLGDFFVGRGDVEQLGGPVKVAKVSGEVSQIGWEAVAMFVIGLSVSSLTRWMIGWPQPSYCASSTVHSPVGTPCHSAAASPWACSPSTCSSLRCRTTCAHSR